MGFCGSDNELSDSITGNEYKGPENNNNVRLEYKRIQNTYFVEKGTKIFERQWKQL
jgi:hypothetical protein